MHHQTFTTFELDYSAAEKRAAQKQRRINRRERKQADKLGRFGR